MRIDLCPELGVFRIRELKRYQIALTKTGKLQFYKVTPYTDLQKLKEREKKHWLATTVIYAYSATEAREKAKELFQKRISKSEWLKRNLPKNYLK